MNLQILLENRVEAAAIILFGIGLTTLLLNRNLIKKIIGFSFMDSAIFLFLASEGYIAGHTAPIQDAAGSLSAASFINPIPAGLVLTGIVVSVSVTAVMLSLTVRLYQRFHTLNLDEIVQLAREANEEEEEAND
ncbi:MAG: cation:proton antiporter subunit C [Clostridia bacterium]|nr:cation:proton antiporter subunit C [Clostridia bacterium]